MTTRITHGMCEKAANAMILKMFAPHELPLSEDLWEKYYHVAAAALEAALSPDGEEPKR